jgi:hypothetical protein
MNTKMEDSIMISISNYFAITNKMKLIKQFSGISDKQTQGKIHIYCVC